NDIRFDPKLGDVLRESCRQWGCYWAYRITGPGATTTDEGSDCFAMTRKWWTVHRHLFPDFLLGYWNWDDVMVRLMRWSGCAEQQRLFYHEPHPQTQSPMRLHTPGAHYNQRLMQNWLQQHQEEWSKPKDV